MLPTSARLLKALSLLQSRRFWTGAALAAALGVTERSVRRDVDRLRELGYPVHATSGVGGGYALGAGRDLPPLPLEDDEAVAVAMGLRAVASGWVSGLEAASVRALSKLEQVLPRRLRRRLGDLEAVSVRLPHAPSSVDADRLAALGSACRDEVVVRFPYVDRQGAPTTRTVEPYRLVHNQIRWYLLAWDLERDDWRTFRVDRVAGPVAAGSRFRPRPLPEDVATFVDRRRSADEWRYRAVLTVEAPADVVRARTGTRHGHVEPLGADRCRLAIGGDDLAWMAAWLGVLGWPFVVHEPPELAETLRAWAARFERATGEVDRGFG